jgi:hypothetical protein
MSIIDTVMRQPEFAERPPVLLDIGASGALHPDWAAIAPYSICIAFDADDRELRHVVSESRGYRKLHLFTALVSDSAGNASPFHLTASPYCSSVLQPRAGDLAAWAFAPSFDVVKTISLPAVTLTDVMKQIGVDGIDWFKSDSQGMDLRLFRSLGDNVCARVLAAEFEPGIIDAYEGEDKLHHVLSAMGESGFWLSDAKVMGTQRMNRTIFESLSYRQKKNVSHYLRTSPCWIELCYLNTCSAEPSKRQLLLAWTIATMKEQHGFACELAAGGRAQYGSGVFDELYAYSENKIRPGLGTIALRAGLGFLRKHLRSGLS